MKEFLSEVSMCARVRERKGEREREKGKERELASDNVDKLTFLHGRA